MAQKLFPILADPNAPSLFDGLDVSLSAGQITALDGSKSLTMTATNGLFQTATAKNSTVSSEELQFNNDLNGTNSSLSSEQMFINSPNRDVNHLTGSLVELSDENSADQNRTTIQKNKIQVVNTAGGNKTAYMDAESVSISHGADSLNMTASTLTANGASASWADIVDGVVNPPATPALQAVLDAGHTAVGESIVLQDATDPVLASTTTNAYGYQVNDNSSGASALMSTSAIRINDGSNSQGRLEPNFVRVGFAGSQDSSATTMTMTGSTGVIASSTGITLDSTNNIVLSAGADSLTITQDAMLSASAGGSTDQYLVLTINGTAYRISLLAPPAP